MANSEHLKVAKRGAAPWNEWRREHRELTPDLREAELSGAFLSGADLSGADLSGADLSHAQLIQAKLLGVQLVQANLFAADLLEADVRVADLREADLRHACLRMAAVRRSDLRGADLGKADLVETLLLSADLSGANLSGADLGGADLKEANLSGANLRGAVLRTTKFLETNLGEADLCEAQLGHALFVKSNLAGTRGLDSVAHNGPSTFDYETFSSSHDLPRVFLQGIGLPDWLIDSYQGYLGSAVQFSSCFISYCHEDESFARRLHDALQGHGVRCWLEEKQSVPGDDISAEVDTGIRPWDTVLLCCSRVSLSSGWVEREIDAALEKEKRLREEHDTQALAIIPLNLDDAFFEWQHAHAPMLRERLAADFRGWERDDARFEAAFGRVVAALRLDDRSREKPPPPQSEPRGARSSPAALKRKKNGAGAGT